MRVDLALDALKRVVHRLAVAAQAIRDGLIGEPAEIEAQYLSLSAESSSVRQIFRLSISSVEIT